MPLLPKEPTDLALAPVAVQIDRNLAQIRDRSPEEIRYDVALQFERAHTDVRRRARRADPRCRGAQRRHAPLARRRERRLHAAEALRRIGFARARSQRLHSALHRKLTRRGRAL